MNKNKAWYNRILYVKCILKLLSFIFLINKAKLNEIASSEYLLLLLLICQKLMINEKKYKIIFKNDIKKLLSIY